MSLLDELKSKSEQLKQSEAEKEVHQARLREIYLRHINPRMKKLYGFINEMIDHLNFIAPDTRANYELPSYGQLPPLLQSNYRLTVDSSDEMGEILLTFQCGLKDNIKIDIKEKAKGEKMEDFLKQERLNFHSQLLRDSLGRPAGTRFFIAKIPVSILFKVEKETATVSLCLRNFLEFGNRRLTYRPHEVNDTFLENLGNFILRKDTKLLDLSISDQAIQQIRKRVEQEKKKRSRELKRLKKQEAKQAQTGDKSLLGLFKNKRT